MHFDAEPWAKELRASSPVLVGAPLGRSGTIAIQRVMNTDPSIVMYSEDLPLIFAAVTTCRVLSWLDANEAEFTLNRSRLRTDDWKGVVTPPPSVYASAHAHGFYRLVECYQRDAEILGGRRWGMKKPDLPLQDYALFQHLVPSTRIVYVVRDIGDCLRSMKAFDRRPPRTSKENCDLWVSNMCSWRAKKDACFTVEFERLENEPEAVTAELSEYLSLDLDASVLANRVNSREGYRPPEPLTDEELRLCEAARAAVWSGDPS